MQDLNVKLTKRSNKQQKSGNEVETSHRESHLSDDESLMW
jgi:hypothetical protein